VDWSAEVHRGDPAEAVTAAAASAQADLLVLGLHRIRALDSLRRTTMERILAGVPCPVLLAHRPAAGPYARILVLTAFAPACAAALRAARRLAPGAALQVLHALDVPLRDRLNPDRAAAEAEAAAARWAGALPLDVPAPLIVPGNLHEVLDIVFEDFRPDLLAVGAASRADDTMPGHWVRDLIRAPRADLLVAPSSLAAAPDRPPASGP
jgi:nucleotide-binding universal stress UspA family protein